MNGWPVVTPLPQIKGHTTLKNGLLQVVFWKIKYRFYKNLTDPLNSSCCQKLQCGERKLKLNEVLQKSSSLEKAAFSRVTMQLQMPQLLF